MRQYEQSCGAPENCVAPERCCQLLHLIIYYLLYIIDVLPLMETLHIQFTQQVVENVGIACSAEFEIRLM